MHESIKNSNFIEHAYFILQKEVDTFNEGVIDFSCRMSGESDHVKYSQEEFLKRHNSDKKIIGIFHEHPYGYNLPSPIDCDTMFGMQQGYSGLPKYCIISEWQLSCDDPIDFEYIKKPSDMIHYPWDFYVYQFNYLTMQYKEIDYDVLLTYTDDIISQASFHFLDDILLS